MKTELKEETINKIEQLLNMIGRDLARNLYCSLPDDKIYKMCKEIVKTEEK